MKRHKIFYHDSNRLQPPPYIIIYDNLEIVVSIFRKENPSLRGLKNQFSV